MFKKYIFSFSILLLIFSFTGSITGEYDENRYANEDIISDSCTYEDYKLYGNIKFVESFPDVKIKIVNSFPDLKVKLVENFPDECGDWKIVENFPDLKVQIVESFPDFTVEFVESFPGKN
jgi:hypothetical protein